MIWIKKYTGNVYPVIDKKERAEFEEIELNMDKIFYIRVANNMDCSKWFLDREFKILYFGKNESNILIDKKDYNKIRIEWGDR